MQRGCTKASFVTIIAVAGACSLTNYNWITNAKLGQKVESQSTKDVTLDRF